MRSFGLISDTHGILHRDVYTHFAGVEAILHAGDLGDYGVKTELDLIATTHAVAGNVDPVLPDWPESRVVELPFGKVGIAHGHLFSTDRERRAAELMKYFSSNDVRLILFGHSHLPSVEWRSGVWLVNPGSAGRPRFRQPSSLMVLRWDADRDLLHYDFRELDWRSS